MTIFLKKRIGATLGNALLWGIAIIAAAYLEANLMLYAVTLPFNTWIVVSATYQLFQITQSIISL